MIHATPSQKAGLKMAGNVFDMNDSNYTEDVYTIWQDDEHSDYWMFNKSDCVVVEGEV